MSLSPEQNQAEKFKGRWLTLEDSSERDDLLREYKTYTYPVQADALREIGDKREEQGSLYPEITEDAFLKKLLKKREFRETLQPKITDETLKQNVCDVEEFEYTSSQKFVSQFMSPNTPYNGMLLYHGVGVGKTCSAVLAAESFLQLSPKNKVYILAPPAIQPGFYRTIFDSSRLTIGKEPDQKNSHEGCTGNRYLELTQTLYEREKGDIETRVNRLINKRYAIMGYVAFRNMVLSILSQIPSTLNPQRKMQQKAVLLQRALSGCLFIVDEAHNMRDVSEGADDDSEQADDVGERSDAAAGKKLTPILREVLKTCEGNKLMLMTATPMYNSYKEIVSLLNLLLYVDKVPTRKAGDLDTDIRILTDSDIVFETKRKGGKEMEVLTEVSENKLIKIANGRVSFMRGENPKAFPVRLDPSDDLRITSWPSMNPNGKTEIKPTQQKIDVLRLPLVKCELTGEPLKVIQDLTKKLVAAKGIGIRTIDTLLQAGNCIFPGEGLDGRVGSEGFQSWFTGKAVSATFEGTRLSVLPQYTPTDPDENYDWMIASDDGLANSSPKFNRVIKTIQTSTGISFVYSRFVENGAVIFCLLLEANGYTPWGRSAPLFSKGSLRGRRQCAKCEKKEEGHPAFSQAQAESRENHKFMPAYYTLLTASDVSTVEKQSLPLSPNNTAAINAARHENNKDGYKIKVVVGSQVAGEGLDLRYIREIHILEGWFHLSKEEQIVGRGIRYCSHNALPRQKRNCTINLYANVFPEELDMETIDLYSYRTAMNKAIRVGNVSRALKRGAADCNLNRDAILVYGLNKKPALDEDGNPNMIDSQGIPRPVDLNDKDYTPICDWIACNYICKPTHNLMDKKKMPDDNGTYDMFAARFAEQMMIHTLRLAFEEQPWYHWSALEKIFPHIPTSTLTSMLLRVVNNPSIVFTNKEQQGHIVFRNNLFLFQPNKIQDTSVPIAFRYGTYPVKRDFYKPDMKAVAKAKTILPESPALASPVVDTPALATQVWLAAMAWVNSWCKDDNILWTTVIEPMSYDIIKFVIDNVDAEEQNIPTVLAELKSLIDNKPKPPKNPSKPSDKEKREKIIYDYGSVSESNKRNVEELFKTIYTIPKTLTDAILKHSDGDTGKKNNIKYRMIQLQWWGKVVAGTPGGMTDLKRVAKEFIWDSFFTGPEQIALLEANVDMAFEGGNEQFRKEGSVTVSRYIDITTKEPIYMCAGSIPCPPSVMKLFVESKTDPVVQAKANSKVSANPYGFMVVWENVIMFKTNDAKNAEGKPPGSGAACSIVSNVKGHRMKLVQLGDILARYNAGNNFELTEDLLATGPRRLTGAPSFCALMEIVMRWMDVRKELHGGLRYFYRPLSSFYSKHKSKK